MSDLLSNTSSALDGISGQMSRLEGITGQFGRTLSKSLVQGIAQGKSFEDILQGMGDKLIKMSLNSAFKPLETIVDSLFGALTGTASSLVSGALGGVGSGTSGGGGFLASGGGNRSKPHHHQHGRDKPGCRQFQGLGGAGECLPCPRRGARPAQPVRTPR